MAKSAPHHWKKARPSPTKGAFKKALRAFVIFCTLQTPRTTHESHTQYIRTPYVIYFTKTQHNGAHITPANVTKMALTDVNTRENLPEASPKGPGSKLFRALAGQRPLRSLGTQGLASRPPEPDKKNP